MTRKASTLIRRVRALAEQYPKGLYHKKGGSCSYTQGRVSNGPDTPGCLIGQAARGYITIPSNLDGSNIMDVLGHIEIDVTPDQIRWLDLVQSRQDTGHHWGRAVEMTDRQITP